jgi:hypothetical protein
MTIRSRLRDEIGARFIPALRSRGFTGPDKIRGNQILHEYGRQCGASREVVAIQFEKRQKPRFVLNLWIEPPGGERAIIESGGVTIQGRITPGRGSGTGSWFRADRPIWQRVVGIRSSLETRAVDQALQFLDSIDDWFREPRETEVVKTIRHDWAAPREPSKA